MPDLITRERALRNLASVSAPTAADYLLIDGLVAACSQAVERHCNRTFAIRAFDELHSGNDRSVLILSNLPVVSVERVATSPTPVLQIANTSAANQRAVVKVSDDGLTLMHVASGVTTTTALAFASYATLSSLAGAVNALGAGWSATVVVGHGDRATADLRATQGAFSCLDTAADLRMHVEELHDFEVDAERGYLLRRDGIFVGGVHAWRIVYSAGFATVPEPVQEACAQWVAVLYWQAKRDPNVTQESIPGVLSRSWHGDMPAMTRTLLRPYRLLRV